MSNYIPKPRKQCNVLLIRQLFALALLVCASVGGSVSSAATSTSITDNYDVEANSNNNSIYILLINDNPASSYDAVAVSAVSPYFLCSDRGIFALL